VADEKVTFVVINHEAIHHAVDKVEGVKASMGFDKLHVVAIVHNCVEGREVSYYVGELGEINFLEHTWSREDQEEQERANLPALWLPAPLGV